MMALGIQLGAKVQRRHYNGMDTPGSVVRLSSVEALIFWPDDNFYEIIPVSELESYDAMRELVAA